MSFDFISHETSVVWQTQMIDADHALTVAIGNGLSRALDDIFLDMTALVPKRRSHHYRMLHEYTDVFCDYINKDLGIYMVPLSTRYP